MEQFKTMAKELGLQIRGTDGEGSSIEDGVVDISNRRRMGYTEFDLIKTLQEGVVSIIKAEEELAAKN